MVWRTVHVNHVKPARIPADGFPIPLPTPEPPLPCTGYLSRSFQQPQPRPPIPPQPAAPAADPIQPAATPPPSRPTTRLSANQNSASRSEPRSPVTPGRANGNSRLGQPLRRSARLNPRACAEKSHPQPAAPQLLKYGQCLHPKDGPYTFCSLVLEDLHSGRKEYLGDIQQLVDALPRSLDPGSRLSLKAQVTPPGQQCLPRSMRASLWWLVPSDRDFQRAPSGNQYYLARQGRRVVLRGGNVTQAGFGSRVNWIYDPAPPPPRRATLHSRNSHVSIPNDRRKNEVSAIATHSSSPAPLSSVPPKKRRMRRRRQARRAANRNAESSSAAPLTQDARWANQRAAVPAGATQPLPENSDPTSARRTPVYPPSRIVGDSLANENSPFQIGLESSRIPGLYKLAVPDQQQDTQARPFRVNNSGSGTSSPPYLLPYTKPFSGRPAGSSMTSPTREAGETLRSGFGIVYPLQPLAHRPDTRVSVDATLPEPAASQRQELPPTVVEIEGISQSQPPPVQKAPPGSPAESAAVTAVPECIGLPRAHRLKGIGVIKITHLV